MIFRCWNMLIIIEFISFQADCHLCSIAPHIDEGIHFAFVFQVCQFNLMLFDLPWVVGDREDGSSLHSVHLYSHCQVYSILDIQLHFLHLSIVLSYILPKWVVKEWIYTFIWDVLLMQVLLRNYSNCCVVVIISNVFGRELVSLHVH